MERNFPEALAHTLAFEGGWSDSPPNDPWAALRGVSSRTDWILQSSILL